MVNTNNYFQEEYNRSFDGIITNYKRISKTINADQPKADVLAQV